MGASRRLVLSPARVLRLAGSESLSPIEHVRNALTGTYEIQADIGHGGMGRVYLARDTWHDRQVAIKVLHPEIAGALGPERFLREIAIASSFVHPNILPLYDSGSANGVLYYVMPYVQGESLREKLTREGQLRVDEAIRIAGDVASALDFAHGRGVVHRDVKPENILLTSGRAMLADFGLAMSADDTRPGPMTLSGYVIGTPAYMSPEQGAPGGQVDGRSDLYALGCVVYEMLAGEAPFAGATDRAVLARHAVDPVPPLRTVRPGIPAELEAAVLRALAKVPADRPTDAMRFAASLVAGPQASEPRSRCRARRIPRYLPLLGVLLAALLPFAVEPTLKPPRTAVVSAARPRVSVSTFTNRTGDPALAPLGELVRSSVTLALTKSHAIEVVDSSTLGRMPVARGRPTGTRTAGALSPDLLISGSYYRVGTSLILQSLITDVRSGTVVFAAEPTSTDPEHLGQMLMSLHEQLVRGLTGSR